MLHRPGLRAQAAHAAQQGRAAVRRRAVGQARPAGARRVRGRARRARRRGAATSQRAARRRARRPRGARRGRSSGRSRARRPRPDRSGPRCASGWTSLPAAELAERLIGGITYDELPFAQRLRWRARSPRSDDFVLAPLPNHLFTRDTSRLDLRRRRRQRDGEAAPGGARRVHLDAIYRHHPLFADATAPRSGATGVGGAGRSRAATCSSSATAACSSAWASGRSPAAVELLARRLFAAGVGEPRDRRRDAGAALGDAPRHRDDDGRPRRVHHLPASSAARSTAYSLRPAGDGLSRRARAGPVRRDRPTRSTSPELRLFETGGDRYEAEREQWDDGNNVLAVAPGVVVAYERNVDTNTAPAPRGHRGDHDRRRRARPRPRRPALHVLPVVRDAVSPTF